MQFNQECMGSAQDLYEFFASIPENLRDKIPVYIDTDSKGDFISADGELYVSDETEDGMDGGITLSLK